MSRRIIHAAALGALAALTAAGPRPHKTRPSNPVSAESVSLTLAGPCVDFGWHNPNIPGKTLFGLDPDGIGLRRLSRTQPLGESAAAGLACPSPYPFSLAIGELSGPHIAANRAQFFIAAGYRVSLGAWTVAGGAGFIYEPIRTRRFRINTVHVGNWFPYLGVQVRVSW